MGINKVIQAVIDMFPNCYQAECGWMQQTIS
ncbi:MAG: hypothetical protein ACJAS9_001417 [Polaribacter sp.]|jgi:hypothetical protein